MDSKRIEELQRIETDALIMVNALIEHGDSQAKIQKRIKLGNYAVAGLVMLFGFLSYTPFGKQEFGDITPLLIAVLGATFLLLDAYTPHMLDDPNPERFRDYAFYIQKYARDIRTHINNNNLSEPEWNATADLLSDWTRTNTDDVLLKFSSVRKYVNHSQNRA